MVFKILSLFNFLPFFIKNIRQLHDFVGLCLHKHISSENFCSLSFLFNWFKCFISQLFGLQRVILFCYLVECMFKSISFQRLFLTVFISFEQKWLKSPWNCNLLATCFKMVAALSINLFLVRHVIFSVFTRIPVFWIFFVGKSISDIHV